MARAFAVAVVLLAPLHAQGPTADVASFKKHTSTDSGGSMGFRGPTEFDMSNGPIGSMLGLAYPAPFNLTEGMPDWVMRERDELTRSLTGLSGRQVVNRTGLTGLYKLTLNFSMGGNDAPLIFTALREQLGLKLESDKGTVDFLVIDHIERPTEN